jgi:hypothetical protein
MWFCVWGAAICWVGLSIASSLIAWRACLHQEQFGGESSHPGLLILNMVLFFLLLAVSIAAGLLGYRYWRRLSGGGNLFHAESPERREYMVMVGVLITVFVGVGIIWFGLPLWLITICARVR